MSRGTKRCTGLSAATSTCWHRSEHAEGVDCMPAAVELRFKIFECCKQELTTAESASLHSITEIITSSVLPALSLSVRRMAGDDQIDLCNRSIDGCSLMS